MYFHLLGWQNNEHGRSQHYEDLHSCSPILKICMGFTHPEDLHGFSLTWLTYMDFHLFWRLMWDFTQLKTCMGFPHPEDLHGLHSSWRLAWASLILKTCVGFYSSWRFAWVFNHPDDLLGILLENEYLINFKMLLELRQHLQLLWLA